LAVRVQIDEWLGSGGSEMVTAQSFAIELTELLGVPLWIALQRCVKWKRARMGVMQLRFVFGVAVLLVAGTPMVHAQNFSCGIGDRGACLGSGDRVCSSSGKCVSDDAQCFDLYQCDSEGFTCKSDVTACSEKYDVLVREYNNVVPAQD
jgi:hypothetical protein